MINFSKIALPSKIRIPLHNGTYEDWTKNNFTRENIPSSAAKADLFWGLNNLGSVNLSHEGGEICIKDAIPEVDFNSLLYTITIEIARLYISDLNILGLHSGSILDLQRSVEEPLHLYIENILLGECEAASVDDTFAVRVTDIFPETKELNKESVPGTGPTVLRVILDRITLTGKEITDLEKGNVLSLNTLTSDPVLVEADGIPLFTANILVPDNEFVLRIREIIEPPLSVSPEEMNDLFDMDADSNESIQEQYVEKECCRDEVEDRIITGLEKSFKKLEQKIDKLSESLNNTVSIITQKLENQKSNLVHEETESAEITEELNLFAIRINQLIQQNSSSEAASLMSSLESKDVVRVMKMMGEETCRKLILPLSMSDTKPVEALERFTAWKAEQKTKPYIVSELLEKAFGKQNAVDMINRTTAGLKFSAASIFTKVTPQRLYPLIAKEDPQTLALILLLLPPDNAAVLFEAFDSIMQTEISQRLASLRPVEQKYIREIERVLESKMFTIFDEPAPSWPNGLDALGDILDKTSLVIKKQVIELMEEEDPDLAEKVKEKLLLFDDILNWNKEHLDKLIETVAVEDVAAALKIVTAENRSSFLDKLEPFTAARIQTMLADPTPLSIQNISDAQKRICTAARFLWKD